MIKASFRFGLSAFLVLSAQGAIRTVTTTDNDNQVSGLKSLYQAISEANDGDTIAFNLPGTGPFYLLTPQTGYPAITKHNLTIDGYSQPGSSANTNSILGANKARLLVFLDSRAGGKTPLNYDGYGATYSCVLAVAGATNVTLRGLGFLGAPVASPSTANPALHFVAFAAKSSAGNVQGCWFGVDAGGTNVYGANVGVSGYPFREGGTTFFANGTMIGVKPGATNAPAQFNVFAGIPLPIAFEAANLRVSGNFLNVFPSGTNDFNAALAGIASLSAIAVGADGNGTLIGTDGDGVNDANERNIFGGLLSTAVSPLGYSHTIEFYGAGQRNNVVVAGNYFGVAIDGATRFTNGVPALSGPRSTTRFGSDFDGVSDALEGNVVFNNYPAESFSGSTATRDFFDGMREEAVISLRGNKLVNNFTPPVNPSQSSGQFLFNYYAKALADPFGELAPVLTTNSTSARLAGRVPLPDSEQYQATIVDLYVADPEGIATGKAAAPAAPNGFIQGRTYLGSFVEGSAADSDPAPGPFRFDLSSLNLAPGTSVTVTANFVQGPIGAHNARTLTTLFSNVIGLSAAPPASSTRIAFTRSASGLTLSWPVSGLTLQFATSLNGPWTTQPTTGNTYTTPFTGQARFFRLVQ